jgi:hypothetical protein
VGRSKILDSDASLLLNEGLGNATKRGLHRGTSLSHIYLGIRLHLPFDDIHLDRRERNQ